MFLFAIEHETKQVPPFSFSVSKRRTFVIAQLIAQL